MENFTTRFHFSKVPSARVPHFQKFQGLEVPGLQELHQIAKVLVFQTTPPGSRVVTLEFKIERLQGFKVPKSVGLQGSRVQKFLFPGFGLPSGLPPSDFQSLGPSPRQPLRSLAPPFGVRSPKKFQRCRVPEFQGSRVPSRVSKFQGSRVPVFHNFEGSRVPRFQGFQGSRFQGSKVPNFQGLPRFPGSRVARFQASNTPFSFRILGSAVGRGTTPRPRDWNPTIILLLGISTSFWR